MMKNILLLILLGISFTACSESNGSSNSVEKGEDNKSVVPKETKKSGVVEVAPNSWYVRLVAEDAARGMKTSNAQLGQLDEANATLKHTLSALSPFGGSWLDVIFENPNNVATGRYKVNFQTYVKDQEASWTFSVKTDDNHMNADVALTWQGLYVLSSYTDAQNRLRYHEHRSLSNPLLKYMKLVDMKTSDEIPVVLQGQVQTYHFNMDGNNTRVFKWVLQTTEVNIPQPVSRRSSTRILNADERRMQEEEVIQRRSESFDVSQPPRIR